MRHIRSFFFGGLAMLAAALFITVPASALDYEPGLASYSTELPNVALVYVDDTAYMLAEAAVPKPGGDAHSLIYASQNQLHTGWRFAVDAYSRIDPHIRAG